jgi:hypothetical protein
MKRSAIAAACIALAAFAACDDAFAGRWEWGCMGALGKDQVIFTRYNLVIVPAKAARGKLRDLIFLDDLAKKFDEAPQYLAADANSGLVQKMEFSRGDDDKITLTEKSSKNISHHSAMVCGRDEDTDVSRKVYRYERKGETARDVTLQCMEYMLTTRGGRPCINRP